MGRTQCADDFPRSGGKVVSRMERLGARSKTAYRQSGTNRFNPTPIAPGKPPNRTRRRPCFLHVNFLSSVCGTVQRSEWDYVDLIKHCWAATASYREETRSQFGIIRKAALCRRRHNA